jgi:hypothetical protein
MKHEPHFLNRPTALTKTQEIERAWDNEVGEDIVKLKLPSLVS